MIILVIDSMERYFFFKRLIDGVYGKYQCIVVTSEPLAHLLCKMAGINSLLVTKKNHEKKFDQIEDLRFAIDVLTGVYSLEEAEINYQSTLALLYSHKDVLNSGIYCLMWNGCQTLNIAVSTFCKNFNIQTKFLEISNLPNKLFVDYLGVNAYSSLYHNVSKLDKYPLIDEKAHSKWLVQYELYKNSPPPQSRTVYRRKFVSLFNAILKIFFPVYKKKIKHIRFKNSASIKIGNNKNDLESTQYIFLPLQVSTDTQLKIHSDIGNLEAIKYAMKKANTMKKKLYVKIHPAEMDDAHISAIIALVGKENIVTNNTTNLIKYAEEVVVINSTVGLESLFYNKKVTILGRAFYKEFHIDRVKKYIHYYLIDGIDYYATDKITCEKVEEILKNI